MGYINGKRKSGDVIVGGGKSVGLNRCDFVRTADGAVVHPVYATFDGYVGVQEFPGEGRVLIQEWRPEQLVAC